MPVKFTGAHAARLQDATAEAIRRVQDKQIVELQGQARELAGARGRLLGRRVLTASSGTYKPAPDARTVHVQQVGGGGGGGGAGTGAGIGGGGGGDAGWYLDFTVTSAKPIAGGAFACGAGGAAGAATPTAGGTGGDTTFVLNGVTFRAKGGTGGTAAVLSADGVTGPNVRQSGSTDVLGMGLGSLSYGEGGIGVWFSGATGASGKGGTSPLGEGGYALGAAASQTGITAPRGGGGGSGGTATTGNTRAGGGGGAGLIIVEEYS